MRYEIKVPASTANLGPGFDVLGAGLGLYLKMSLTFPIPEQTHLIYSGDSADQVSLDPKLNFISKIICWVGNVYSVRTRPHYKLEIENNIPLGRGLGSSGSACIGAIAAANLLYSLSLSKRQMLDLGLLLEGHPDNIAGTLFGGWVASYTQLSVPNFKDEWFEENATVPNPASLLKDSGIVGEYLTTPMPISINPKVKCVVCIPRFHLSTHLARSVLPKSYTRPQVIFNLSRLTMLTHALGKEVVEADVVFDCMRDMIHQVQRQHLVPGLSKCLALHPRDVPGLLGTCLSGAGPTVLALATHNFEEIGKLMHSIFAAETGPNGTMIESDYLVLEFDQTGLSWSSL